MMNPSLGSQSSGSRPVTFDLSWCWSWRSSSVVNNWDAAWVFVKYRKNGGDWAHATLNDTGHVMGTGTAATYDLGLVDPTAAYNLSTNPAVGAFIYRSGVGAGTFSQTGTSLSWNYAQDGVADNDTVEVQVFGIEMVLVPQGTFFAGDRDTSTGSFKQGSSDTDAWYIGSESAISVTNTSGNGSNAGETLGSYYYQTDSSSDDDATGSAFTIPAGYPKGYDAFYIMKGEISQGQWVAFFNTLTATQKSTRDLTGANGKNSDSLTYRNNVSWPGSGNATLPIQGGGANYEATAMSYLRWSDLAAYLDWSGLRPMSELEFERAARGPYPALAGEYAWGSTSITQATSVSDPGGLIEAAELGANCSYGSHASVQGPLRVGSFSYEKASRIPAGGGYYGSMDLSGNLTERTVTVGNSDGRAFEGSYHGNGVLDSSGDADVSTWPGTSASGVGFRGGAWSKAATYARTSDRTDAAKITSTSASDSGGRGVRSAPAGLSPTPTPTATP